MWVLWSKIYFIKILFENFMKWGLKGGISFDADSGPFRYVLWCCGSICYQLFTFIWICFGHTVTNKFPIVIFLNEKTNPAILNHFVSIYTVWNWKGNICKQIKVPLLLTVLLSILLSKLPWCGPLLCIDFWKFFHKFHMGTL